MTEYTAEFESRRTKGEMGGVRGFADISGKGDSSHEGGRNSPGAVGQRIRQKPSGAETQTFTGGLV